MPPCNSPAALPRVCRRETHWLCWCMSLPPQRPTAQRLPAASVSVASAASTCTQTVASASVSAVQICSAVALSGPRDAVGSKRRRPSRAEGTGSCLHHPVLADAATTRLAAAAARGDNESLVACTTYAQRQAAAASAAALASVARAADGAYAEHESAAGKPPVTSATPDCEQGFSSSTEGGCPQCCRCRSCDIRVAQYMQRSGFLLHASQGAVDGVLVAVRASSGSGSGSAAAAPREQRCPAAAQMVTTSTSTALPSPRKRLHRCYDACQLVAQQPARGTTRKCSS
jgi:hypothetical protein